MSKQSRTPSDYAVGIDLGGTNIQAGVLGPDNKTMSRVKIKTSAIEGSNAVVGRLVAVVHGAIKEAGLKKNQVRCVGIGAAGAIDFKRGVVLTAVNLRWNHFPLRSRLQSALRMDVVVDNDVNAAAWGEHVIGAGKNQSDMLAVWVGTGIGGGLVLNGRLYRGASFTAGEIGQTIILADGALGRRTVENFSSRTAMVNLLNELIAANHPSKIVELEKGHPENARSKTLAKALNMKDELTYEVLNRAAHYLGVSIANSVTLLGLQCVVLGGGLTDALKNQWLDWVRESFRSVVFPAELGSCRFVTSQLGDDAGWIGAALIARQNCG